MDNENKKKFIGLFANLQNFVHKNAEAKGFWDTENIIEETNDMPPGEKCDVQTGEKYALMVSELMEALEGARASEKMFDDKIPTFLTEEAELADCIIRIMDYAERRGLCVASALVAKVEYNEGREYKHGKKF